MRVRVRAQRVSRRRCLIRRGRRRRRRSRCRRGRGRQVCAGGIEAAEQERRRRRCRYSRRGRRRRSGAGAEGRRLRQRRQRRRRGQQRLRWHRRRRRRRGHLHWRRLLGRFSRSGSRHSSHYRRSSSSGRRGWLGGRHRLGGRRGRLARRRGRNRRRRAALLHSHRRAALRQRRRRLGSSFGFPRLADGREILSPSRRPSMAVGNAVGGVTVAGGARRSRPLRRSLLRLRLSSGAHRSRPCIGLGSRSSRVSRGARASRLRRPARLVLRFLSLSRRSRLLRGGGALLLRFLFALLVALAGFFRLLSRSSRRLGVQLRQQRRARNLGSGGSRLGGRRLHAAPHRRQRARHQARGGVAAGAGHQAVQRHDASLVRCLEGGVDQFSLPPGARQRRQRAVALLAAPRGRAGTRRDGRLSAGCHRREVPRALRQKLCVRQPFLQRLLRLLQLVRARLGGHQLQARGSRR